MSFLGVASGGASHKSTSLELSELSDETASSNILWFCWTEMSCCTSLAAAVPSKLLLEDVPSPCSDCEDSGSPAFLDGSPLVDCTGTSKKEPEKEVVGVSMALGCSQGASKVDRFVSGCSALEELAFLFLRSRLVREGLLSTGSNEVCSLLLDVPLKTECKHSKTVTVLALEKKTKNKTPASYILPSKMCSTFSVQ